MLTRRNLVKLGTFGLVGGTSTAVYLIVFEICTLVFALGPSVCNVAAYLAAMTVSYVGHHTFTFRAAGRHDFYGPRFALQAVVSYGISAIIAALGGHFAAPHFVIAIIIAILLPLVNFCVLQFWVFVHPARDN